MTPDRIIHGLVGVTMCGAYIFLKKPPWNIGEKLLFTGAGLLGTWIPDWDLYLGIAYHRCPFTHSALPVLITHYATKPISKEVAPLGVGIGLASHLLWDTVDYGDVRLISGAFWDKFFLASNAVGLILWAFRKRITNKTSQYYSFPMNVTSRKSKRDSDLSMSNNSVKVDNYFAKFENRIKVPELVDNMTSDIAKSEDKLENFKRKTQRLHSDIDRFLYKAEIDTLRKMTWDNSNFFRLNNEHDTYPTKSNSGLIKSTIQEKSNTEKTGMVKKLNHKRSRVSRLFAKAELMKMEKEMNRSQEYVINND